MIQFPDKTQLLDDDQAEEFNTNLTISEQTIAVLALIDAAPDDTFHTMTRMQKLMFIAQNGGLEYVSNNLQTNYPSLPEHFSFEQHNHGPYSSFLDDYLDRLDNDHLINITEVTTPANNPRLDYTLTPAGENALEYGREHMDDTHLKTISFTTDIYYDVPMFELTDMLYIEGENVL